ncbi:putative nucleotidyltransferase component of viral defense system [Cupriavidus metallidurans]|uniref:hypothetical protein n=1 Tax=Cupriavidus metallidurans TaxID=119219 RepID=UPI00055DE205|nr:hypothetical protein [Cupriavidus metallidurans]MDE4918384.1 hypothetical protein [Cupriavidus metallidurans]
MNEEFEKMRAEFEAWASENYYDVTRLKSEYDNYKSYFTHVAWEAWQASRKQAVEEAAKLCERESTTSESGNDPFDSGYGCACDNLAIAIRALQKT